jgi:hypothetical protein
MRNEDKEWIKGLKEEQMWTKQTSTI